MPRIALVGDRSASVRAHTRIPALLEGMDVYWVPTEDGHDVRGFDGIWLVPGSPYTSESGALAAVRTTRENGIPFLGTCGGFQHALLEFARNVCGLDVHHAENTPEAPHQIMVPLECSLIGHEGSVILQPGSRAAHILGAERTTERYHCAYATNPTYITTLQTHGLHFTGHDPHQSHPRIAELPTHPFFLTTLFQPELSPTPHPLKRAFTHHVTKTNTRTIG